MPIGDKLFIEPTVTHEETAGSPRFRQTIDAANAAETKEEKKKIAFDAAKQRFSETAMAFAIPVGGGAFGPIAAAATNVGFGVHGAVNLAGKNGIRKTVNLFKQGDYPAAFTSLAGDALDASMVIPAAKILDNGLTIGRGLLTGKLKFGNSSTLKPQTTRLYRITGTSGDFTPSPDGTSEFTGMGFTDDPDKIGWYGENTFKLSKRTGIENPLELQVVDIPTSQLEKYRASNILKNQTGIEYEPEDFLIPLSINRKRAPIKLTGNLLMDQKTGLPLITARSYTPPTAKPVQVSLSEPVMNSTTKPLSVAEKLGIPKGERGNPKVLEDPYYGGYQQGNQRYNAAIASGNIEEAQRLRDLHFKSKALGNKLTESRNPLPLYHFSDAKFTQFDPKKIGTNDPGFYGKGIYTSPQRPYASTYGENEYQLYGYSKHPFETRNDIDRSAASFSFNRIDDGSPMIDLDMTNLRGELQNADAVYQQGVSFARDDKPIGEVVVPELSKLKLVSPITKTDAGEIIPIIKRDNFHNMDIRYKQGGILKGQNGLVSIWDKAYNSQFGNAFRTFLKGSGYNLSDEDYLKKHGFNKPQTGFAPLPSVPESGPFEGIEYLTKGHFGTGAKYNAGLQISETEKEASRVLNLAKAVKENPRGSKFLQKSVQEQDDIVKYGNGERFNSLQSLKQYPKEFKKFQNGINNYQQGGKVDFEYYLSTLPENQRDSTDYNVKRYGELNGKPKDFKEAVKRDMFSLEDDGYWHASSIAYNEETGEYEFMKAPNHPTIQLELDAYNKNRRFKRKYQLDSTSTPGKYVPIIKRNGGIIKGQNGLSEIGYNVLIKPKIKKLGIEEVRRRLYDNIVPFSYNAPITRTVSALNDKKHQGNPVIKSNARDDIFATYLQIPEDKRHKYDDAITVQNSEYIPTQKNNESVNYKKLNLPQEDVDKLVDDATKTHSGLSQKFLSKKHVPITKKDGKEMYSPLKIGENRLTTALQNYVGPHTISVGLDPQKGEYVSYYDKGDLAPVSIKGNDETKGIGKPVELYDRIYLDDYYGVNSTPQDDSYYGGYIEPSVITSIGKPHNGNLVLKQVGGIIKYQLGGSVNQSIAFTPYTLPEQKKETKLLDDELDLTPYQPTVIFKNTPKQEEIEVAPLPEVTSENPEETKEVTYAPIGNLTEKDVKVLNTDGTESEKQVATIKYLCQELDLKPEQAAGLVGIFTHESHFRLNAENQMEKRGENENVKPGEHGIGINQGTFGRHHDYVRWIKEHGNNSLKTQLDFAIDEIKRKFPDFLNNLRNAENVQDATAYTGMQYTGAQHKNFTKEYMYSTLIPKKEAASAAWLQKHFGKVGTQGKLERRVKYANEALQKYVDSMK